MAIAVKDDGVFVPRASVELFGVMASGEPVHLICLQSKVDDVVCGASIITRGATVQEIRVPDKDGNLADVVLGFETLGGYNGPTNFCYGGTPGRYANRIANGKLKIGDGQHDTTANWDGPSGNKHTLHGGAKGFDSKIWSIEKGPWVDLEGAYVTLTCTSPDGEEGFPGSVAAKVTYSWQRGPEQGSYSLNIHWEATSDMPTVVNLTNHSYFNLCGVETASQALNSHSVTLNCDRWAEVDGDGIPSGKLPNVEGTCMDFRTSKLLGKDIKDAQGGGFDHCFVVNGALDSPSQMRFVAKVECSSGRTLEVWATQPGVQLFTMQPASVFDMATTGKYGQVYPVHGGFCLETQHFPDSLNQPDFPSTLLSPERPYSESCSYRFAVICG